MLFLEDRTYFVTAQHRKANFCRTIGLCILKDTGLGFSFYLWDSLTQELLLGLLGWREIRGVVSPLSESPLGQPLVPGNEWDRN
jgi:hypothetical protein